MSVTWIKQVINSTANSVYIKNTCHQNAGNLTGVGGGGSFTLDDHRFHELLAGITYNASSFGIPWEGTGKITFTMDYSAGWEIYTSSNDIVFENMKTGQVDHKKPIQSDVTLVATESGGKLVVSIV